MRTLTFDVIADSRFESNPKDVMEQMATAILNGLNSRPDVIAVRTNTRHLTFPTSHVGLEPSSTSERTTILVQKFSRQTTWNNIYGIVGRVKATAYSFENRAELRR
jgi:hypothetical protein